jgi:thiol-disulfide isomerase/thioredoxin
MKFSSWCILLASTFMMGSSLCWADSSGAADDPSLRTWTNKNTGSTVEARPVALNMKTVKLVTTAKKPITMPLEKLSDEDRAWLEEHKEVIGKPIAEWSSMPSGPVAEEMKGKTYMLENGKLKKRDGKLNPKHFILYFSASWCGPCCRNAPHSVEAYDRVVKDNPDVEVIMCNLDQNLDAAQKWAAANNMPWPILLKEDLTELAKKVAPRGIPTMILVDKDGKPIQSSQNMEQLVKAIGSSRSSR